VLGDWYVLQYEVWRHDKAIEEHKQQASASKQSHPAATLSIVVSIPTEWQEASYGDGIGVVTFEMKL
jgi:hypothetical protein